DISAFNTSYDDPNDTPPPNGGPFNYIYAYFLTTADAPFTFINDPPLVGVSLDGNFDFSSLPEGNYRVWGASILIENLFVFLTTQNITSIQDLLDIVECPYDVDVTNLDNMNGNGEVIVKIVPQPDQIQGFTIDTCASDTLGNGRPVITINYFDYSGNFNIPGSPSIFWYFDIDTSFTIPNASINQEAQTVYAVADFGTCRSAPIPVILNLNPPVDPSWIPLTGPICRNAPIYDLDAAVTGQSGGSFSGIGVVDEGGGNFSFFPTLAGEGIEIITYTIDNGTCGNVQSHEFDIRNFPVGNDIEISICQNTKYGDRDLTINLNEYHIDISTNSALTFNWYRDLTLSDEIFNPENFTVDQTKIYVKLFDGESFYDQIQIDLIVEELLSDAGENIEICESTNVPLMANTIDGDWVTLGDGSFDDPTANETSYNFGANDLNSGVIQLIWNANFDDLGCSIVSDTIEIILGA
ncbi:MAG: hypothetical protein AAGK97_13785, partial [Bacteroidota bacterium]